MAHHPQAAGRVTIGFYNVENLYDTVKSPLVQDTDFTPQGRYRWDPARYNRKMDQLAHVLSDANFDLVGLSEVENAEVLKELTDRTKVDYAYVHIDADDPRGIEQALLYKGDKFFPERARLVPSGFIRQYLHVSGELCGIKVEILVCHLPSPRNTGAIRRKALNALLSFADSIQRADPGVNLIIMGDMNRTPDQPPLSEVFRNGTRHSASGSLHNPLYPAWREGRWSYLYKGKRQLLDHIYLSGTLMPRMRECGVFVRPYMLAPQGDPDAGSPYRTYAEGRYRGGPSDHLPVYVVLDTGVL